jgi:cytochrome c peroxidase
VRRWRRAAEVAALALALVGAGEPGGGERRPDSGAAGPAATPGAGPEALETPEPGTYALPALRDAADGDVLATDGTGARLFEVFGDRVVLLSFVYTRCHEAEGCPMATAVLRRVGHVVAGDPELRDRVRLVTLSFDPRRDTPEVMRRYAQGFAASRADHVFLTTRSETELRPLLEGYGQTVVPETDEQGREVGSLAHLLRVFLIDRERRVRNVYGADFLGADALLADLKTLLREGPPAAGDADAAAAAPRTRPGDDRRGYERADYASRSVAVTARRGRALDLAARIGAPPLGLPPVPVPADNPATPSRVALGRRLFYDRRLSLNDTFSCAMCHVPEQGFAHNELATAVGIEGRTVRRNAPTLYNVAYLERLFLDGRENRLEQQIWGPLLASNEMGNPSVGALLEKIGDLPGYAGAFAEAFPGRGLSMETLGMAIASYERTLVSGGSAFDRWYYGGEADALGAAAQRGFALFTGPAGCSACHGVGPDAALFTDGDLHNTGVGFAAAMGAASGTRRVQVGPGAWLDVDAGIVSQVAEAPPADLGRYEITLDPADRWRYRTPSLRNVALTAPYMHDGSLASLRDVVAFYDRGGVPNEDLDPRIRPLGLDAGAIDDLVAFLESLTGADVDALVADAFAAPIGDAGARRPTWGRPTRSEPQASEGR